MAMQIVAQTCGSAGEGGIVRSDGACTHDEDGGRGEDNLEAVAVWSVTYVIEVVMFIVPPIVDHHLEDVVIKCYVVAGEVD